MGSLVFERLKLAQETDIVWRASKMAARITENYIIEKR